MTGKSEKSLTLDAWDKRGGGGKRKLEMGLGLHVVEAGRRQRDYNMGGTTCEAALERDRFNLEKEIVKSGGGAGVLGGASEGAWGRNVKQAEYILGPGHHKKSI